MDRGAHEKISIRESVGPLKTYGSISKHLIRQENYIKHFVSNTDTLQGIALKYNVTIEQIRRVNKLWASDSLFLREFLLIPTSEPSDSKQGNNVDIPSPSTVSASSSFDCDNIDDFLNKIDKSIAVTKEDVKKIRRNSKLQTSHDLSAESQHPDNSRTKKIANNNSSNDLCQNAHTVLIQHGKKVKTSLRQHEEQQEELFQL